MPPGIPEGTPILISGIEETLKKMDVKKLAREAVSSIAPANSPVPPPPLR
jgi:hypothetical protein